MITSLAIFIIVFLFGIALAPFFVLNALFFTGPAFAGIEAKIISVFAWLIAPIGYFSDFVPLNDIMSAISMLVLFFSWYYAIRFIYWLFSFVPGIKGGTKPFEKTQDDFAERHGWYPKTGGKPYTENVDASRWYKR